MTPADIPADISVDISVDAVTGGLLEEMLVGGYVRQQRHPELPLRIFNYTERAVYERVWNVATRRCRGLVADADGVVRARPWPKMFNLGEPDASELDGSEPVVATDKLDGSLGVLFPVPGGWAVATRGSFVSDQARHATAIWHREYAAKFTPPPGVTVLVEIVYPGNRIVLDYGDRDELVLLGGVEIATGRSVEVSGWPGSVAARFEYRTLADALAAPPRAGAEGMVLHVPRTDERVKLKQIDYVALHRLIFGLTARRVWERLAVAAAHSDNPDAPVKEIARMLRLAPADAAAILETGAAWWEEVRRTLPEEFHDWLEETAAELRTQADTVRDAALARALELGGLPRRDAAAALTNDPNRGLVFAALDGKPIVARAWAAVRPEHERPLLQRGEDVA
ncbi:MAG: RNA ligase [Pseudonocardia sp.]